MSRALQTRLCRATFTGGRWISVRLLRAARLDPGRAPGRWRPHPGVSRRRPRVCSSRFSRRSATLTTSRCRSSSPAPLSIRSSQSRCVRSTSSGQSLGGCGPRLKYIDWFGSGITTSSEREGRGAGSSSHADADAAPLFRGRHVRGKTGDDAGRLQLLRRLHHANPGIGAGHRQQLDMLARFLGQRHGFRKYHLLLLEKI